MWVGSADSTIVRNGADFWMRGWLQQFGLGEALILPGLVVAGLMTWHLWCKHPWRLSFETLGGMLAESLLFALVLILIGQLQEFAFQHWSEPFLKCPALNA